MKIRALVAKTDGAPDSRNMAFAQKSIAPTKNVPITQNFDRRLPPIGKADIEVEPDGDVYAIIHTDANVYGRYPALGGIATEQSHRTIKAFDIREVSICISGNADTRIQPIQKL